MVFRLIEVGGGKRKWRCNGGDDRNVTKKMSERKVKKSILAERLSDVAQRLARAIRGMHVMSPAAFLTR